MAINKQTFFPSAYNSEMDTVVGIKTEKIEKIEKIETNTFSCVVCHLQFGSQKSLNRHNRTVQKCITKDVVLLECRKEGCSAKYRRNDFRVRHERSTHGIGTSIPKRKQGSTDATTLSLAETSLQIPKEKQGPVVIKVVILNEDPPEADYAKFLESIKPSLAKILLDGLQEHQKITASITLYESFCPDGRDTNYFNLQSPADVEDTVDVVINLFSLNNNGFGYNIIHHLEIDIRKVKKPVGWAIPLHPDIVATKGVLSVKNSDSYCFKWAILAGLSSENHIVKNLSLTKSYDIKDISLNRINCREFILDFSGLTFPMEVRDTKIFEKNNPTLSVNVFGVEDVGGTFKIIGPLYRTREEQNRHVNLLFYENKERNSCHYAWIRSLVLLLKKQLWMDNSRVDICNTCLMYFTNRERFLEHKADKTGCSILRTL